MLIPWNTDAPIYHWPYATVGLIVANTLAFFAILSADPETVSDWALWHGAGLHPLQWVSSNFVHGGIMHLLGNMVFLWSFGLVVEGKLGWWRFLAVYMGIGVAQCALEQICTLGMEPGGSFGASAIVYGLLGMALVWAPKNDMSCLLILGIRIFVFDLAILWVAAIYFVIELITAFIIGEPVSSAVLHLTGAVMGLIAGVVFLKLDWVDCENWDIFALWNDRLGEGQCKRRARPKQAEQAADESEEDPAEALERESERLAHIETIRRSFRQALSDGNLDAARLLIEKAARGSPEGLANADLIAWIKSLHDRRAWAESLPWMVRSLQQYPQGSERMRLKLAQVLITDLNRPGQALSVLAKLKVSALPEQLENARAKLFQRATQMQEEAATFEVGLEDW
ncbi:MAG: rhomboid family intramembrane serine protease [Pirellulales bacterium]